MTIGSAHISSTPERSQEQTRTVPIADLSCGAIIAIAADGRIGFWNAGAADMFLYAEQEALGRWVGQLNGSGKDGRACR